MDAVQDVVIIGAGSAGLSAYKEAKKFTDKVVVIDKGPLGTTCARTGCMPSKVFIQAANYYHQRHYFESMGIIGQEHVKVNVAKVMQHVRELRDFFTEGVIKSTKAIGDRLINGEASFVDPNTVEVNGERIKSKAFIIATGSRSKIPKPWLAFEDDILVSENFFEQDNFPNKIGVIGAGSIGLELGQSLAYLGKDVNMFHARDMIGGLSDPKVNQTAITIFKKDLNLYLNEQVELNHHHDGLQITGKNNTPVQKVVAAIGRSPNIEHLNLDLLGVPCDERGIPKYDKTTMNIENSSIFIAGDTNADKALLHEAADEGRIAGYNATHNTQCFRRRTPIRMLFTEPNIAVVGQSFRELAGKDIVIGEVDYSNQGRARVMMKNEGILRIYGNKKTGHLLGAEMVSPSGEHIAHLLAWAIDKNLTVFDVLQMPFYHPTVEEGMRTALRDLEKQIEKKSSDFDLALCDSEAMDSLA